MGSCFSYQNYLKYNGVYEFIKLDSQNANIGYLSQSDDCFAIGSQKDTVNIHNKNNYVRQNKLFGHKGGVNCVQLFRNQSKIVTGGTDRSIRIWDYKTCQCLEIKEQAHNLMITSLCINKDDTKLISGGADCLLKIWNIEKLQLQLVLDKSEIAILNSKFSYNDSYIVAAYTDQTIKLWRGSDIQKSIFPEKQFSKLNNPFMGYDLLAFTQKEGILCIAGPGKNISFVELGRFIRECPPIIDAHENSVSAVLFSREGNQIVSGDQNGNIKIWSFFTLQCQYMLQIHTCRINSLMLIYPSEKILKMDQIVLLSGSGDFKIVKWNLEYSQNDTKDETIIIK